MTLAPCRSDIYANGRAVFVTHTLPAAAVEAWVVEIARLSEQPVDWHYACGRACVLTTGNAERVWLAMRQARTAHDEAYVRAVAELLPDNPVSDELRVRASLDALWSHNWEQRNPHADAA